MRCQTAGGRQIEVSLPNPGRLYELLLPGATLYLTENPRSSGESQRKTDYTAVAVERDGLPVFLHTHQTNAIARWLIESGRIAQLAGARVKRSEVVVGRSRFDFLVEHAGRSRLVEVKSCTLFGNGVGMFPDAVTDRGRRHLLELASPACREYRPLVLFLVHTPLVRWFMPDFHTDLAFSQTLLEVRDRLDILALAIDWQRDLSIGPVVRTLEIPWNWLREEVKDRGSYLLVLELARDRKLTVGQLGELQFDTGYYIYVGSAMQNLRARLAWHQRKRKKPHWHIDYVRLAADHAVSLPIRSSQRQECTVARALTSVLTPVHPGFGCSDCRCPAHLYYTRTHPLQNAAFHTVLQEFRMQCPRTQT